MWSDIFDIVRYHFKIKNHLVNYVVYVWQLLDKQLHGWIVLIVTVSDMAKWPEVKDHLCQSVQTCIRRQSHTDKPRE